MKRAFLVVATAVASLVLLVPATAGARLAQAGQFEGTVAANQCGPTQFVTLNGPTQLRVLFAGTNAAGYLYGQILGPSNEVVSMTGSYAIPSGGRYGVRACFVADEGIDGPTVNYVGLVLTGTR